MRKQFLEAGKIVGTHGVRGMVRIDPWSDSGEFLQAFERFYLDREKTEMRVLRLVPHGRIVIAAFEGIDTVEKAEALRGKVLYLKREDVTLDDGRYFIDELIGCTVTDADTGTLLGRLTDVSPTGANDVWHIEKDGHEYLVPAIPDVIVTVDIDTEQIVLRPLGGIFDDAD